jgi:putative ABC transport system substrate-binding protein
MTAWDRRDVLLALAVGLGSFQTAAQAAPKLRRIGILMGLGNDAETQARLRAFEHGLAAEGWQIGQNIELIYRFAGGDKARMFDYAREFVALPVDCIVGHSTPVLGVLLSVTDTVPIVFVSVSDPIGSGFVRSMAHPGGNATGFTLLHPKIAGKYLTLLHDLKPDLHRATLMYNPESVPSAGAYFMPSFMEAAARYQISPSIAEVNSAADIERAIAELGRGSDGALITVPDNFLTVHRDRIIETAARFRVPAIYPYHYFAEAGGLISYGVDAVNLFERATDYVSRILKGTAPADLPVQSPTKFELVINLKTARALGLEVPRFLLVGADRVIE